MVIFHNTTGMTNDIHKKSLHGGMPVHYGEKWACNLWFREKPYERPGAKRAPSSASGRPKPGGRKGRKNQKAARRKNR